MEQSAIFIRAIALTFGFIGLQQVLTGSLRGAGDTVAPMVLAMISLWVMRFPLAYVLSAHTTCTCGGIWYTFPMTTVISAAMAGDWYKWGGWRNKRLLDEVANSRSRSREARIRRNRSRRGRDRRGQFILRTLGELSSIDIQPAPVLVKCAKYSALFHT